MTRNAGMKIKDLNRISSVLKFSGIFYAHGANINRILKQLENPNHNDWSKDRAAKPKEAAKFLKAMNRFIKETIKQTYTEKVADEVDAYGVSDFLPGDINSIRLNKNGSKVKHDSVNVELGEVRKKADTAVVREYSSSGGDGDADDGVTKGGVGEGNSYGTAYDGLGNKGGLGLGNDYGYGNRPGTNGPAAGNDMFIKNGNRRRKITTVKYRCIEIDYTKGLYRILIKPEQVLENIKIVVDSVGDSGSKDMVQLKEASYHTSNLPIKASSLYIESLKANLWQTITIKLNRNTRLKLEVEIYANR